MNTNILKKTVFNGLNNPNVFLEHLNELKQDTPNQKDLNPFPVDIFPLHIQRIITATNESLNFPIDFTGASILFAVSVAVGNTFKVEIKKEFEQNAVIYLAIVGRAGTNKSHPLSFALKPIEARDNLKFQKYQKEKQEFDSIANLSKKEKEQQGQEELVKPIWEQHLVTDFTPESITDVLTFNKRGIGVYSDELASWFKNFNRYSNGSEEQFWLSVWSGKSLRINRKTSEPIYLPLPFISVAGTIQPGILNELAKDRTENGFMDRLLFVVPKNLKKEYWSEKELNPVISDNWDKIITNLLNLTAPQNEIQNIQPEILKFTPEAKKVLFDWQRKITDISNNTQNEALIGIYAKIEMYAARLSLILEMMRFACGESDKKAIGIKAVQGALKLVEYFKDSAVMVNSIISNVSPLDKLPADKQNLYNALPDIFTTNEGVKVAENMGIAERTFKYFICKTDLFNKYKRGEYKKLF